MRVDELIKLEDRLALGSEAFVHDPDREPVVDGIAEWIWNDRIGEDRFDFNKGLIFWSQDYKGDQLNVTFRCIYALLLCFVDSSINKKTQQKC